MLEVVAATLNQPETRDTKFKQDNNRCGITGAQHIEYSYKPSISGTEAAHIIPHKAALTSSCLHWKTKAVRNQSCVLCPALR